eukprot:TRINITY_DN1921_c0_g1_i2.p1 TRINITY_DN1921_c0_g1~~TRINITY_DN1921_c0_g1_i2.p1  ORF type:complete len:302 (-),score=79.17 TRINITY_DN1921_c0_g1_i2:59-964(-)
MPPTDWRSLNVGWCTPLSAAYATSPAVVPSLQYELVMVLTACGLLHRAQAREQLHALASGAGPADDAAYKQVANLLCRAAGIFEHTAGLPLSAWTQGLKIYEMTADVHTLFFNLCLLEAQEVTIKKAVATNVSPNTIAKLCFGVAQKARICDQLRANLKVQASEVRFGALNAYCALTAHTYRCHGYTLLAAQSVKSGQVGQGIALMQLAQPTADEEKLYSATVAKEALPEFLRGNAHVRAEAVARLQQYCKDNSSIYFDTVPDATTLAAPESACLAKPVTYVPPVPATVTIKVSETSCCLQ